jgi:hypothetical protein
MPEIDFETAKRLNSAFTKAHPQWVPHAAAFKGSESQGAFASKFAFALSGAEPDYVSVALSDVIFTVFVAAGDLAYVGTATPEGSSVAVLPFALDSVLVRQTPDVLRSAANFEFGALEVDIEFGDFSLSLPGHGNDSNEEALAAFFPRLLEHLKRAS